jgi:cytochrome b
MSDLAPEPITKKKIKVWDGGIRLFHWCLVILFCLSSYSAFQDKFGNHADIHFYAGYCVLILVVWRIFWGIWGSETARFSQFIKSPFAAIRHLRAMISGAPYTEVGHSSLGGFSVLLMLILLLAQAVMGLFASDGMIFSGPLSAEVSDRLASNLTTWHKLLGLILLGVVAVHILAVLFYAIFKRVNLVWPMITGRAFVGEDIQAPKARSLWLALALFVAAGAGVCSWVFIF